MKYEEIFIRAERAGQDGSFLRIDEDHPADMFLGIERGHRVLMIRCCGRPPEPPVFAAVRVEIRQSASKSWLLVLRLERPELKTLFNRLIEDLDTACRDRPETACDTTIDRLARWQRLFSRGTSGILSDQEIRGLAAELAFLLDEAMPARGLGPAVSAWVGPRGAPKDFVFADREVEVKSIHRQRHSVLISSLEQLSDAGLPVFLWTRVVELLGAPVPGGASLTDLVARARRAVLGNSLPQEQLEESLLFAGYEDNPAYNAKHLRLGDAACYAVRADFPRLQRSESSSHIISCKYEIGLNGLDRYLIGTWR